MKLNLYQIKIISYTLILLIKDTGKPLENITNAVLNFTDCNGGTIIDNKDIHQKQIKH